MLHIYGVVGKTAQLKVVNSGQTTSRLSPIRLDCVLPDERDMTQIAIRDQMNRMEWDDNQV